MFPSSRIQRSLPRAPLVLLVLLMIIDPALGLGHAAARHPTPREAPGTPAFQRTWERTDQPVISGAASRTWMWGPDAFTSVLSEDYVDAPAGSRQVQYFDKARMEITHPDAPGDGLWYVTNGLLVVELLSGRMQVGDDAFIDRTPAQVNVAGDADDPSGPTYATFSLLRDAPALPDFATIIQRVDRAGVVSDDPSLAVHNITVAHHVEVPGIDHQIADPFWTFMNSSGTVYQDGTYTQDQLFTNPFYATGYPISEAYWASVKVATTYRDVLMQCFERRCLTYTPGNPDGFLTEAGNVGQHYHTWRYAQPANSLVINEVLYFPDPEGDQPLAFVELLNPTADLRDLSGAMLTNSDGSRSVALPNWVLPQGAYLAIYFGAGTSDPDFSDLSGSYYVDPGSEPFFSIEHDAAALYAGAPGVDTIVDFVAWSATETPASGAAHDDAVAAGIWTAGAYYDASSGPISLELADFAMRVPVVAGGSIGRNATGSDSDAPADFAPFGGVDSVVASPGSVNENTIDSIILPAVDEPAPAAAGEPLADRQARPRQPQPAQLPKKTWTIMVYMDGRDSNLRDAWIADINKMERIGSDANINIVVQLMEPNASSNRLRRWYVERETTDSLKQPVQTSNDAALAAPGDPATLTAFIDWAELHYPASHYAIVLAGHGDGWKGSMIAGARLDHLNMAEIDAGLAALNAGKFDALIWYSCLMGQTEVAYQMEKRAKYMIASEEVTWSITIPWQGFVTELRANLDWTDRQFAVRFAFLWADALEAGAASKRTFTMAAIDLAVVHADLATALTDFSSQLESDIDTLINNLDNPLDNVQIKVKKEAREKSETFTDKNFIDTYHFAELVKKLGIPASSKAQPVMDAVLNSTPMIRKGSKHPNANGLSIYFPHDALRPNGGSTWGRAFDDPLYDPYDEQIPTAGTHYYKRDANLLVPKIRALEYPFKDDPSFDFPVNTTWDELLHRYYKPVADACIRFGGTCVKEVTIPVGTKVTLSGNGSSDSDGREGPSNDVPAHAAANSIHHYYWDFKPATDTGGAKPPYADNTEYNDCDGEDCDRDDVDDLDDDKDAQGKTVEFTCATAGTYPIHFMVWDEHHNEVRERIENIKVNKGKHWLQFNVDESDVLVTCIIEKKSVPDETGHDSRFEYVISIIGNPALTGPADAAMTDPLPSEVVLDGEIACTSGACTYDASTHTVHWEGTVEPNQVVEVRVPVRVPPEEPPGQPPVPPEIVNCATIHDGVESRQACATTTIIEPVAHLEKVVSVESIVPGESIHYTITVPYFGTGVQEIAAEMHDQLPEHVQIASEVLCSTGECGYDEEAREVIWMGLVLAGEVVTIEFDVLLPVTEQPLESIENCATYADANGASDEACVVTPIVLT